MSVNVVEAQTKLQQAKTFKDSGNELFKLGQYNKARVKYSTALAFTRGLPGREMKGVEAMAQLASQNDRGGKLGKELADEIDEFDAIIKTNIATCYLKLDKPHDALNAGREALQYKPTHWKAQLRIAEAKEKIKDYDGCLKTLSNIINLVEVVNDKGAMALVKKLQDLANRGLKKEDAMQRKAFSNIFERARTADSAAATAVPAPASISPTPPSESSEAETTNPESKNSTST